MSVFSAEITMQICSAPAAIIRSTRYSETALGLSWPSMRREPTGRSSLEQPNGWMRWPAPAAGIIPIIGPPDWLQLWMKLILLLQNIGASVWPGLRRYVHSELVCGHALRWRAARLQEHAAPLPLLRRWIPLADLVPR